MSDTVLKIGKGVSVWEPEDEEELLEFMTSNLTKFLGVNARFDLKVVSRSPESSEYEYITSDSFALSFLLVCFKEIRTQKLISCEAFFQQKCPNFIDYLKMDWALRQMRRLGL